MEPREAQTQLAGQVSSLLPAPGEWQDADYLWLTRRTHQLVELADGVIEVLAMPSERHQAMVAQLFLAFLAVAQRIGGKVVFAPFRLRLRTGRFREPDLLVLRSAGDARRHDAYWDGADLVIEVLSEDDPERDTVTKRREYAEAGIAEYWIVDGKAETITVLQLEAGGYREHGSFGRGTAATSLILPGLGVNADNVFDAR
ncbi:MAG: Uma2 family endonuclease [Deltaproteobacteria bacterium]|nr:Uma2 family endonuclease [Deltaproteobacteria bacterium]